MCITVQAKSDFMIGNEINSKYLADLDSADVIIAYSGTMVGNGESETGLNADGHESNDRTTISLPYRDRHVSAICNADGNIYSDKTVVVMQTVGEVDVTPFKDHCRAMLWTSYNGQRQGEALANILSGDVNPSGKLTSTWYAPSDLEIMTCGGVHTTDSERITWKRNNYSIRQSYDVNGKCTWPGRTYMYYNGVPQYPFGYGLSYTSFEYSNLRLDKKSVDANGTVTASVDIKNTGSETGSEIMQLYVHSPNGDGINLPIQQLAGFKRVTLAAGETKTISIDVNIKNLAQYSETLEKYYMPTGKYDLWVGRNVTDKAVTDSFEMTGTLASTIKTVSSVPSGLVVKGAYSSETNTTETITSVTQELSMVMTDEQIYDLSKADIHYTSTDENIAKVDENGIISAGINEGVTTITASVTINGETKTVSIPIVCELQQAIPSAVRAEFITKLENEYNQYIENNYRDKYWTQLTNIYNTAKEDLRAELVEANLQTVFEKALADMAAVRDTLEEGEMAYTVIVTPDWYKNADVEIIYNGDEDSPSGEINIYKNDNILKTETCTAIVEQNQTIHLTGFEYNDEITCVVVNGNNAISEQVSETVKQPPSHVEYNLSDAKYKRLAALSSGEVFDEINGVGGMGAFNDISNVNYKYTYNGKEYTLTGGFQGGKGSFTKTNIYFKPFDCYNKATVTVLFDSAGSDRIVKIAQQGGNVLGEKGGIGNKKIVALTVEVTDLSKLVYILPQNKNSIYMIIVDYEGENTALQFR